MEKLFLTILGMSGTASVVILMVLLVRLVLRRAPKAFSFALWAVVLFRLLCPFSIESAFSLAPKVQVKSRGDWNDYPMVAIDMSSREVTITVDDAPVVLPEPPDASVTAAPAAPGRWSIAGTVWLAGAAAFLTCGGVSLLLLRRRLIGAVPLEGERGVRLADHIPSPFVLGLARPQIYLPSGLPERERDYILLHERTHIARFDHVTRALAWLALAVHWFNPLVWLAFHLAGKDMEMSCDEAVLRKMGREIRADYSSSLLRLSAGGRLPAGPLAFGGGTLWGRVKNVLRYKRPALWVVAAALIAVVCAGAALATSPGGVQEVPDAGLDEFAPIYTMDGTGDGSGTVIVEGLGDAYVEWRGPDASPSGGWLYFSDPAFCCPSLAGKQIDGDAMWTDETRTAVAVTMGASDNYTLLNSDAGLYINFAVELDSGTVLHKTFLPEGETLELTDQEMVDMARALAELLTGAEAVYESSAAPGLSPDQDAPDF